MHKHQLDLELTALEQRSPGPFDNFRVRWYYANNWTLMQHRWYFASLHGHQIAANTINDWLKDHKSIEHLHSSIQHETAETAWEKETKVIQRCLKSVQLKS